MDDPQDRKKEALRSVRRSTGATAAQCWTALKASDWNAERAILSMQAGLAQTNDMEGRERPLGGIVATASEHHAGAIIELAVDPSSAAQFPEIELEAVHTARLALRVAGAADALMEAHLDGNSLVARWSHLSRRLGCRIAIRRIGRLNVSSGVVARWVSGPQTDSGGLGVLVALESAGEPDLLRGLAQRIAQHIAQEAPLFAFVQSIPEAARKAKRWLLAEDVAKSGRTPSELEFEIDARLRHYYREVILEWQPMHDDPTRTVGEVLKSAEQAAGVPITLTGFHRFQAGEVLADFRSAGLADEIEWSFGNAWAEEVPSEVYTLGDVVVFQCAPTGPALRNDRDVVDLLSAAWNRRAGAIVIPTSRLPDDFLPLETRVAGQILQKFATFGTKAVFLGDISEATGRSAALRAFVRETNNRGDIWFLPDQAALVARMAREAH